METNNLNVKTAEKELERLANRAQDAESKLEDVNSELQTVLAESARREEELETEMVG